MADLGRTAAALFALLWGIGGCTTWRVVTAPRIAPCPGPELTADALPDGRRLHQRIAIRSERVDARLDVVLERSGEAWVALGLNGIGVPVFEARASAIERRIDDKLGRAFPVPPENVLRDVARARRASRGLPAEEPGVEVTLTETAQGARSVEIRHPRCRYRATVVTLSDEALP